MNLSLIVFQPMLVSHLQYCLCGQPEKLPRLALLALAWERREVGSMSSNV